MIREAPTGKVWSEKKKPTVLEKAEVRLNDEPFIERVCIQKLKKDFKEVFKTKSPFPVGEISLALLSENSEPVLSNLFRRATWSYNFV